MKITLLTAALSLGLAFAAQAVEPLAPVQQQLFTCNPSSSGVSRVSTTETAPTGCCSPKSRCAEYLSTTTLDHQSKANHT